MTHKSELVDYNSQEFSAGYAAGKASEPDTIPVGCITDAQHTSWLEGWLMGDAEKREQ